MKKIVLLFFLTPFFVSAQRIGSETTDPFTGVRNVKTTVERLSNGKLLAMAGADISKGDTSLYIILSPLVDHYTELKGGRVFIRYTDGSIDSMDCAPIPKVAFSGDFLPALIRLNRSQVQTLITKDIDRIRVEASNRWADAAVDKKRAGMVGRLLKMVINAL